MNISRILIASDIVSYTLNRISRILIETDIVSYESNRISRILIETDIVSYNSNRVSRILIEIDIVSYESNRVSRIILRPISYHMNPVHRFAMLCFARITMNISRIILNALAPGWASDIVSYKSSSPFCVAGI